MRDITLTSLARTIAACLFGLFLAVSVAQAREAGLEKVGEHAGIDWTAMRVTAQGFGSAPAGADPSRVEAMAARAAVLDARRNLLEAVGSVRIDSMTTVRDFMTASDAVFSRVSGVIQGAGVDRVAKQDDGTFMAQVSMPLTGGLMAELMARPEEKKQPGPGPETAALERRLRGMEAELARLRQQNAEQRKELEANRTASAQLVEVRERLEKHAEMLAELEKQPGAPVMTVPPTPSLPGYTGLVVDARGLGFKPTLKPELYAGNDLVYPGPGLDADNAARQGLARYYRDLTQAQESPLAGELPMTVKAGALKQGREGALVLDQEASAILRDLAMSSGGFLDQAKVVIVF